MLVLGPHQIRTQSDDSCQTLLSSWKRTLRWEESGLILGLTDLNPPANLERRIWIGHITQMAGELFVPPRALSLWRLQAKRIQTKPSTKPICVSVLQIGKTGDSLAVYARRIWTTCMQL